MNSTFKIIYSLFFVSITIVTGRAAQDGGRRGRSGAGGAEKTAAGEEGAGGAHGRECARPGARRTGFIAAIFSTAVIDRTGGRMVVLTL